MTPEELARAVAEALQEAGPPEGRIRILVRGGTCDPGEFDAAFLAALDEAAAWLDAERVEVVHPPVVRVCGDCGAFFEAADCTATCPRCGGEPFSAWLEERIAFEVC